MFEQIYNMSWHEINRNLPLLAAGSSRSVYIVDGGYVIKVAVNRDGEKQCRMENRVFREAGAYLRRYLCPVVWYKPGMVAMVRAVPMVPLEKVVGDPHVDSFIFVDDNSFRDLKELSKRFGLLYEDLLSATSWGYIGKVPVLVDYGCKD